MKNLAYRGPRAAQIALQSGLQGLMASNDSDYSYLSRLRERNELYYFSRVEEPGCLDVGEQATYKISVIAPRIAYPYVHGMYPPYAAEAIVGVYPSQEIDTDTFQQERFPTQPRIEDPYYHAIMESVKKSKSILQLQPDWDDEGAPQIAHETWLRAVEFVIRYFRWAKTSAQVLIPAPKIFPSPEGGIDLTWRTKEYSLLIHIPPDSEASALYIGSFAGGATKEEPFSTESFNDREHWNVLDYLKKG
jgi:hypothetical protein